MVKLIGAGSNCSAIGARVEVSKEGHGLSQAVMGGGSHYSQRALTLHFGLGQAPKV